MEISEAVAGMREDQLRHVHHSAPRRQRIIKPPDSSLVPVSSKP